MKQPKQIDDEKVKGLVEKVCMKKMSASVRSCTILFIMWWGGILLYFLRHNMITSVHNMESLLGDPYFQRILLQHTKFGILYQIKKYCQWVKVYKKNKKKEDSDGRRKNKNDSKRAKGSKHLFDE